MFTKHQNLHQSEALEIPTTYYGNAYWESFNINRFILNISNSILPKEMNFLVFASNSKSKPYLTSDGFWVIPSHEEIDIRNLKKGKKKSPTLIYPF